MNTAQKLSLWSVGIICLAVVAQPWVPVWAFSALILGGLAVTAVGLLLVQRDVRDVDEVLALEDRWREQRRRCRNG